jgi:uncharacterized protein (TIGR02145 family)
MRNSIKTSIHIALFYGLILGVYSCKKDKVTFPILTTTNLTEITQTTAVSGGNITDDVGDEVTARGVCWSLIQNPTTADSKTTDGSGTGSFTSNITGLTENTLYYVRAYAVNSEGTAYGNEKSFTTQEIKDADGNVYTSVTIGEQVWMAENLKTTKYSDGTPIPNVTDLTEWPNLTTDAYCWYDNKIANKTPYGGLYNWYAVNTGKLCPSGWHVPSDNEWHRLILFLDPNANLDNPESIIAGGKLKEAGTTHWKSPNTGATNEIGFTALPGGYHNEYYTSEDWSFLEIGEKGMWWSATDDGDPDGGAWFWIMHYTANGVGRDGDSKKMGLSVRCLKN